MIQAWIESDEEASVSNSTVSSSFLRYTSSETNDHERLDFHEHKHVGDSTVASVVFNFVNAVVGSGILALPYAFLQGGMVLSVFMCVTVCAITEYTVRQLVSIGVKEGVGNYEELMDKLFGFPGYASVLLALFLYDFGAMLTYLIIVGDVSTSIAREMAIELFDISENSTILVDNWSLRRACTITCSTLLILPLCFLRDISNLERISLFAVFTTIFVITAVIGKTAYYSENSVADDEPWLTVVGENPSAAFGIFAFAFVCHDTAFIFFNSLRNRSRKNWKRTTQISLALISIICITLAVPGYVSFRSQTKQNVLENYRQSDSVMILVRLLFLLTMCFTYPITFFICRHTINEITYRWEHRNKERIPGTPSGLSIKQNSTARHLLLTLTLFLLSLVVVLYIDKLGFVMSVTGTISAVTIAFIFPPLCSIKSGRHEDRSVQLMTESKFLGLSHEISKSFDYIILVFGISTMLFCTYQNLTNH